MRERGELLVKTSAQRLLFEDDGIMTILESYTREAGVRQLAEGVPAEVIRQRHLRVAAAQAIGVAATISASF